MKTYVPFLEAQQPFDKNHDANQWFVMKDDKELI
jgi:hypothetical protein